MAPWSQNSFYLSVCHGARHAVPIRYWRTARSCEHHWLAIFEDLEFPGKTVLRQRVSLHELTRSETFKTLQQPPQPFAQQLALSSARTPNRWQPEYASKECCFSKIANLKIWFSTWLHYRLPFLNQILNWILERTPHLSQLFIFAPVEGGPVMCCPFPCWSVETGWPSILSSRFALGGRTSP